MTIADISQNQLGPLSINNLVILSSQEMVQMVFCDLWHKFPKYATNVSLQVVVISLWGILYRWLSPRATSLTVFKIICAPCTLNFGHNLAAGCTHFGTCAPEECTLFQNVSIQPCAHGKPPGAWCVPLHPGVCTK